jgi:hypothetical protein
MASARRTWSFFNPGPLPGSCGGSVLGLPSSRVPPVETCRPLGPRWRPDRHRRVADRNAAFRAGEHVGSPQLIPVFGAPCCGLSPRSSWLRTADCSAARKIRYRPAGGLWPGGTTDLYRGSGTHWATLASFMYCANPLASGFAWRNSCRVRPWRRVASCAGAAWLCRQAMSVLFMLSTGPVSTGVAFCHG